MASPKKRSKPSGDGKNKPLNKVEVGQRVIVPCYGSGTVIAVACRRGFHYRDAWVRPDDGSVREIGLRYRHGMLPER